MNRKLDNDISSWLQAEATESRERAESAFGALFASFPRLAPTPGFAERVMWAMQPAPSAALTPAWAPGWKAVTAIALALAGIATAFLPVLRWVPIGRPSIGAVFQTWTQAVVGLAEWLEAGLATWAFLAGLSRTMSVVVATPQVATAIFITALVGVVGLYTLNHLLVFERRTWS